MISIFMENSENLYFPTNFVETFATSSIWNSKLLQIQRQQKAVPNIASEKSCGLQILP